MPTGDRRIGLDRRQAPPGVDRMASTSGGADTGGIVVGEDPVRRTFEIVELAAAAPTTRSPRRSGAPARPTAESAGTGCPCGASGEPARTRASGRRVAASIGEPQRVADDDQRRHRHAEPRLPAASRSRTPRRESRSRCRRTPSARFCADRRETSVARARSRRRSSRASSAEHDDVGRPLRERRGAAEAQRHLRPARAPARR